MGDINSRYYVGKTIQINYDAILVQADETCLFCLTRAQQMALIAIMEPLGWAKRWYSPTGAVITKDFVENFLAQTEARIMSDVCQDIIDKLNHIEGLINDLQSSLDISQAGQDVALAGLLSELTGIVEPSIAGVAAAIAGVSLQVSGVQGTSNAIKADVESTDFGLAEIDEDVDNIEASVGKIRSSVTNIYNFTTVLNFNTYGSFDSSVIDTTPTEIYARANALCAAAKEWILLEVYAVLDALGAAPSDLAALDLQIDVTFRSLSLMLSTGSSYPYDPATIFAAVSDSAAVDDIVCAIVTQLGPLAPTQDNFKIALDAYTPPPYPDNRAILVAALNEAWDFLDAWTTFASILVDEFNAQMALAPTSYTCTACPPALLRTWDFRLGQKNPWLFEKGSYVPGYGLVAQLEWIPAFSVYHRLAKCTIAWDGVTHINRVTLGLFDSTQAEGRGTGGAQHWHYVEWFKLVAGVETSQGLSLMTGGSAALDVDKEIYVDLAAAGVTTVVPTKISIYSQVEVWNHWYETVKIEQL